MLVLYGVTIYNFAFHSTTTTAAYNFSPHFHRLGVWYLKQLGSQAHGWLVVQLGFKSISVFLIQELTLSINTAWCYLDIFSIYL